MSAPALSPGGSPRAAAHFARQRVLRTTAIAATVVVGAALVAAFGLSPHPLAVSQAGSVVSLGEGGVVASPSGSIVVESAGIIASISSTETPRRPPRLCLVTRAYVGAKLDFEQYLWPSIVAFVDWRVTSFTLVLDADSDADHAWGAALAAGAFKGLPADVRYAALPPDEVLAHRPFDEPHITMTDHQRYKTAGYTRQLWDTFWLDTWLPADAADGDVLGVVDTDAPLLAFLTPAALLDGRGRLHVPVLNNSTNYPGDADLFAAGAAPSSSTRSATGDSTGNGLASVLDAMGTNIMPQVSWKESGAARGV